jgi:hypothetical protein
VADGKDERMARPAAGHQLLLTIALCLVAVAIVTVAIRNAQAHPVRAHPASFRADRHAHP